MGQKIDKFLLLMWKNWKLQYRKPIQTAIEILVPVLFSVLLVVIRSLVDPEHHDTVIYNPFCTLPINIPGVCDVNPQNTQALGDVVNFTNYELIYSPKNDKIDDLMRPFGWIFSTVEGLPNSSFLNDYYAMHASNTTFAAIQFDDSLADRNDLGPDKNVKVSIRFPSELRTESDVNWMTNLIFPSFQVPGPREPDSQTGASPSYYQEGFLALQHMVSILITWKQANFTVPDEQTELLSFMETHNIPFINMRRFPYASYQSDGILTVLKSFVSNIIMLSLLYTCLNTVRALTQEKEKQLKEAMKIMGLPNWLHWTAWFVKIFTFLMVSVILIVVLLKVKLYQNTDFTVFTYANPFVLLIFLIIYVCASITFCFAVSVFFSKANTAATIAGLSWYLSYVPYAVFSQNYDTMSLGAKLVSSLLSNSAMGFGFQIILGYEGTEEGIQFSNLWKPTTVNDDLSVGVVMIMLIVDCFLYLIIALYVEAVFPGEYGVPQKWYFPFTKSYWCGHPKYSGGEDFDDNEANEGEFFESEPKHLQAGIKIRNLKKTFGSKTAVRNLSLNMYEGQITVLLGHNGAGKTTTMSMLTGMFPPTSGAAIVGGRNIRTDMEGVRNSLALCPQHNILFDDLTVAEHLYFFSRLKGLKGKEIESEITKYVNLLELQPKRDARSNTLSGGMKRKLCVGMALCGKSQVVMLDEPTAGMDPSARRALWDLLLSQKTGRTILLTTHFMDEADLLGDRIAIMAGGELQCCGTSFFLKKKYGAGYHLIMEKTSKCDPGNVTTLLREHIPKIEVHSNVGSELTYLLAESQSAIFETMLRDLEQHSSELGVNSYGISLTTLEEVFMIVGADHGQEEMYSGQQPDNKDTTDEAHVLHTPVNIATGSLSSGQLLLNQIMAMSMKKILSTLRSWILLLIQILVPVVFLTATILMSKNNGKNESLPAMPLDLSKFTDPVVLVDGVGNSSAYAAKYQSAAGSAYQQVTSINETIIHLTAEVPATVRRSYIGGASFNTFDNPILSKYFDGSFTAYFNNDPYHTPGIALALAVDAMYRKIVDCDDCSLKFDNYPLKYTAETQINRLTNGNGTGFQMSFNISFSMAFVSSIFIIFVVRENVTKAKHLQFVSGAKVIVLWLTTWFWDFITYLVAAIVFLIALLCFQQDGYKTGAEIGRLFIILLLFGWSVLPMIYLAGFLFEVPSTGYSRMSLISVLTGTIAVVVVQILTTVGHKNIADALHWVFLVLPHYSLGSGVGDTYTLYYYNEMCSQYFEMCRQRCPTCTESECLVNQPYLQSQCEDLDERYFKWESPGIGRNVVFSSIVGAVLLIALLLLEYRAFSRITTMIRKRYSTMPPELPHEDPDVQAEKHKIRNIPEQELIQNYTMVLKDLTKYYKSFLAVNGLSLGIKNYECFGLLGINGAGKTTTFKMLTGDVSISYGDAWVNGKSIRHDIKEVHKFIGYCPQFDALLDDLTARETLIMFGLLRGIPRNDCKRLAVKLASDFDYKRHLDKKVKELSGGNKRKLSTSIALIGDPPVLYLDEPTTGMDPATKRYLWNVLCTVRDAGKTIVLTSHSMEECEALCTRLAIMVNGSFKCLGSTQHLKSKFAEGFTLTIKVKKPEDSSANYHTATDKIEKFIQDNFPGSVLREKHEELLTYYVTDKTMPWSKMFGILEKGKRMDLYIEDYSLGQSSLEQVFLTFTKHQSITAE